MIAAVMGKPWAWVDDDIIVSRKPCNADEGKHAHVFHARIGFWGQKARRILADLIQINLLEGMQIPNDFVLMLVHDHAVDMQQAAKVLAG